MGKMPSDLADNYTGAFDGHLAFGTKPALLIVDMVMAYFTPESPLFANCPEVLEKNIALVAKARAGKVPIIFTNVVYDTPSDGGLFYKKVPALKVFDAGSPLGAFPPQLTPQNRDVVITKHYASAFFETPLATTLRALGVDTVLITGVSTSGCVRATALDALQNGFAPFVVADACGDRHPAPHGATLFDLQAKYAEVIDAKEACAFLAAHRP